MNIRRNRGVAVASGLGAVVSSAGITVLGFSAPAIAAAAPACDASQTDAAVTATLKSLNGAALKTYMKSKAYVTLHTNTTKAKLAWTKAKGAKAKAAAKKKWTTAAAREAAALAAFKKVNTYAAYSGVNTPNPITTTSADHPGTYDWGTYTTRIITKAGMVQAVCTFVDQTNDGRVDVQPPVPASAADKATSQSTYQGVDKPFATSDIPGTLPVLWAATLYGVPKTQAGIDANVNTCIHQDFTVTTAPCTKGGLNDPMTGLTGATYTVQGYSASLHSALVAAKAAKSIG